MTCSFRVISAVTLATIFASALPQAQQGRRQQPGAATVALEASLKVGNAAYNAKGQGSCTYARQASIYNVLSEMWTVRHEADGQALQLTVWKPKDGSPQMFSLSMNGKPEANISTVRGGQVSGSGTVTFEPSAKGGTFKVDAQQKSGPSITWSIRCEAFTAAVAEGGE